MIQRGSTPTHTFTVTEDLTGADDVFVTYAQDSAPVIIKHGADCSVTSTTVVTQLTRTETLKLNPNQQVRMQIDAPFPDGSHPVSDIVITNVGELLRE